MVTLQIQLNPMTNPLRKTAVLLDIESTGIVDPEPIEVAYLKFDTPKDVLKFSTEFYSRFKPSKRIELGALATHHILDEDLADCPPSSNFALPDDAAYLIGHNIDYDWRAIGSPDIKRICTLALSKHFWPNIDSHKQIALIYFLRRKQAKELVREAHNALADVGLCEIILSELIELIQPQYDHEITWEDIWQVSEEARIVKVISFGKHAGTKINDLPIDYKQWVLNKHAQAGGASTWDPYLIKAIDQSMVDVN
jgi:exodeoxyribonuclease X